ncbi:MAG TPA: response regulator [Candidatus Binatia bacterium]
MPDGTLKALIIDDSPTDAQTLSYLLSKRLQTRVEIANDGLEGLDKLATGYFDLAFLDIQMPVMNGVEVLREIRASPNTAELPVIVISSNSDAQTVRSLLELKIFDYVVKPYNAELIVKRFQERLLPRKGRPILPGEMPFRDEGNARRSGTQVLMIADEKASFRHFFVSMLGAQYHVYEANDGDQAVALASRHRPNVIFAGTKLGGVSRDNLVTQLRRTENIGAPRIIAIDADDETAELDAKLYDGRLGRTLTAQALKEAVRKIVTAPELEPARKDGVSALKRALISAAEQVFGMMMSTEIAIVQSPAKIELSETVTIASIELFSYTERTCLTVRSRCAQSCIIAMATRMLLMDEAEAAQNLAMAQNSLAETLNIMGGRIKASLAEEGRSFFSGLPKVGEKSATQIEPEPEQGSQVSFAAGEKIQFSINIWMRALSSEKIACAKLSDGMRLAAPLEVDANKRWDAGSIFTADMISTVKAMGFDEVEVFEPL